MKITKPFYFVRMIERALVFYSHYPTVEEAVTAAVDARKVFGVPVKLLQAGPVLVPIAVEHRVSSLPAPDQPGFSFSWE